MECVFTTKVIVSDLRQWARRLVFDEWATMWRDIDANKIWEIKDCGGLVLQPSDVSSRWSSIGMGSARSYPTYSWLHTSLILSACVWHLQSTAYHSSSALHAPSAPHVLWSGPCSRFVPFIFHHGLDSWKLLPQCTSRATVSTLLAFSEHVLFNHIAYFDRRCMTAAVG